MNELIESLSDFKLSHYRKYYEVIMSAVEQINIVSPKFKANPFSLLAPRSINFSLLFKNF